ncbi:Cof-type HAD-IIB family hydrolase [Pediococcus siamensis]|uniref:Cof-type HAD-IIB family hydrolase n=1 Tax=Pediococcus siamensis TaxID=381829 RepID=UPI0039A17ED3
MQSYQGIVFFDLDNTLLNEQHGVDMDVLMAIQTLKQNHILPVIATGRSAGIISNILKLTGINSIVALNGQYVALEGKQVYSQSVPRLLLQRFMQFTDERGIALSLYDAYHEWATGVNLAMKRSYASIHMPLPVVDRKRYETVPVYMLIAMTENLADDQLLKTEFPEFDFFRNAKFAIDIVLKGISKQTGIQQALKAIGQENIPTFAFGDGPNDLALMRAVDHGVAMANGVPETKAAAEFVSTDFRQHGVINGLKHFDLI